MTFNTDYLTKLKTEMETRLGCKIDVVEDRECGYPVKLEYARNYARDYHVLRVNPARCVNGYPLFSILLFSKLQFEELPDGSVGVLQPATNADDNARFDADFKADPVGRQLLANLGDKADSTESMLFGGLITQSCSQVLEMLAADVVLRDYPEAVEDMKQYLAEKAVEGAAVSYDELLGIYPRFVVDTNRILNLLFAMRCGEICGRKFVDAYNPTAEEIDRGLDLYNFYRAERDSLQSKGKIVGDVMRNVLHEVKIDRYVHLSVLEIAPRNVTIRQDADDGLTDEQRKSLKEFYENFGDGKSDSDLMVLGMYKVLRDVRNMPLELVRSLAIEIAMLGANGISPTEKYTLRGLPNRGKIWGVRFSRTTTSREPRYFQTRSIRLDFHTRRRIRVQLKC